MLSIVMPAHDAAPFIAASLRELLSSLDAWGEPVEVVVVDDGSYDETATVVEAMAAQDGRVRLVRLRENRGKGAAVRAGVAASRGDITVFTDADLPYDPPQVLRVVEQVRRNADVAVGARSLVEGGKAAYGVRRKLASTAFAKIVERAFALGVRDTQCGLKAFRIEVARDLFGALTVEGFAFDVELLLLARHWGLRVAPVPVTMRPSRRSSIRLARHSWQMAADLVRLHRLARRGDLPDRPSGTVTDAAAPPELG